MYLKFIFILNPAIAFWQFPQVKHFGFFLSNFSRMHEKTSYLAHKEMFTSMATAFLFYKIKRRAIEDNFNLINHHMVGFT